MTFMTSSKFLAAGPLDAEEIARRCRSYPRYLRDFLDALIGMSLAGAA
jgi:hypothetical protein